MTLNEPKIAEKTLFLPNFPKIRLKTYPAYVNFLHAISSSKFFLATFLSFFPAILLSPPLTFHILLIWCAYMHAWESKGYCWFQLVEISFTSFSFLNIFDFFYLVINKFGPLHTALAYQEIIHFD